MSLFLLMSPLARAQETPPSEPTPVEIQTPVPALAGYQDGFFLRTADEKFLLKVGSRINLGYTYGFLSGRADFSSFDLHHAKIYAGGYAFSPNLQFYVQAGGAAHTRAPLDAPNAESQDGAFTLEDYYVRPAYEDLSLQFGQFKTPFGRQWMIYSGNLEFVDRALVTRYFALGRDRGITLNGTRETFAFSLGVFNGGNAPLPGGPLPLLAPDSTGQNTSNGASGSRTGHLYLGRFVAFPVGSAGYSEGDVEKTGSAKLELAVGVAFDEGRGVDLDGNGTADLFAADILSVGAETVLKYAGAALQMEFFYRRIYASPDHEAFGFYVQPAVFLEPKRAELAARFGWIEPDTGVPGDRTYEAAAALNFYLFRDHRYKTQMQYTWRGQQSPASGRLDDHFIDLAFQFTI